MAHPEAVTVRLAAPADSAEVVRLVSALLVELGGSALEPARAREVYAELVASHDLGFVALAESEGTVTAVCTVSWAHALRSQGRYAIVQEMYVAPELRSSGVGRRVLELALAVARERGCPFVELGTPAAGARQIAFYRGSGFVPVGERLRCRLIDS